MERDRLRKLLQDVKSGAVEVPSAIEQLRTLPFENFGFASVDHHRTIRQGFPEVIFGEGKTADQVITIARGLLKQGNRLLATRVDQTVGRALCRLDRRAVYHVLARAVVVNRRPKALKGDVLI